MTLRFAQNYALPARYSLSAPDVLKVLSLSPDGASDECFGDEPFDNKLVHDFLVHLQGDGMIRGPPWQFTEKGLQSLAVGVQLTEVRKVCKRLYLDVDLSEATLFELLLEMDAAGFNCKELDKKEIAETNNNPYMFGSSPKTWFKRVGCVACSRLYLLALLKADHHKTAVPHFARQDNVYRALLGMERKVVKPQCSKVPAASSLGPCPDDFDVKATKVQAKKVKVIERNDESGSSNEERESEDDIDGDSEETSSASSGDNSSSSSTSESSSASSPAHHAGKKNMNASFSYGPHLITPTPKGGYQLTCNHPDHKASAHCTKTQTASEKTGGDQGALRRLKFWASMANEARSKDAHKEKWELVVLA